MPLYSHFKYVACESRITYLFIMKYPNRQCVRLIEHRHRSIFIYIMHLSAVCTRAYNSNVVLMIPHRCLYWITMWLHVQECAAAARFNATGAQNWALFSDTCASWIRFVIASFTPDQFRNFNENEKKTTEAEEEKKTRMILKHKLVITRSYSAVAARHHRSPHDAFHGSIAHQMTFSALVHISSTIWPVSQCDPVLWPLKNYNEMFALSGSSLVCHWTFFPILMMPIGSNKSTVLSLNNSIPYKIWKKDRKMIIYVGIKWCPHGTRVATFKPTINIYLDWTYSILFEAIWWVSVHSPRLTNETPVHSMGCHALFSLRLTEQKSHHRNALGSEWNCVYVCVCVSVLSAHPGSSFLCQLIFEWFCMRLVLALIAHTRRDIIDQCPSDDYDDDMLHLPNYYRHCTKRAQMGLWSFPDCVTIRMRFCRSPMAMLVGGEQFNRPINGCGHFWLVEENVRLPLIVQVCFHCIIAIDWISHTTEHMLVMAIVHSIWTVAFTLDCYCQVVYWITRPMIGYFYMHV